MRLLRLRGRKVCDRLLRQGKVWKGKQMSIRWLPSAPRHPSSVEGQAAVYAGTIASTKLDASAVRRNRMRRRCREALRLTLPEYEGSHSLQLLIAPRSSSLKAPFGDLQADIHAFLRIHLHGRFVQAQ